MAFNVPAPPDYHLYMDSALQRKLLSMFHYALRPSGFLVLGHAESIGYHSDLFAVMNKKSKVYRKKATATPARSSRSSI